MGSREGGGCAPLETGPGRLNPFGTGGGAAAAAQPRAAQGCPRQRPPPSREPPPGPGRGSPGAAVPRCRARCAPAPWRPAARPLRSSGAAGRDGPRSPPRTRVPCVLGEPSRARCEGTGEPGPLGAAGGRHRARPGGAAAAPQLGRTPRRRERLPSAPGRPRALLGPGRGRPRTRVTRRPRCLLPPGAVLPRRAASRCFTSAKAKTFSLPFSIKVSK